MAESPAISPEQLARRRGDYGFDAPYVPITFIVIGIALLGLTALVCLILNQRVLAGGRPRHLLMAGGAAEDAAIRSADAILLFGADPIEFLPQPWRYAAPVWAIRDRRAPILPVLLLRGPRRGCYPRRYTRGPG